MVAPGSRATAARLALARYRAHLSDRGSIYRADVVREHRCWRVSYRGRRARNALAQPPIRIERLGLTRLLAIRPQSHGRGRKRLDLAPCARDQPRLLLRDEVLAGLHPAGDPRQVPVNPQQLLSRQSPL